MSSIFGAAASATFSLLNTDEAGIYECITPNGVAVRETPSQTANRSRGPAYKESREALGVVQGQGKHGTTLKYLKWKTGGGYSALVDPDSPDRMLFKVIQLCSPPGDSAPGGASSATVAAPSPPTPVKWKYVCHAKERIPYYMTTAISQVPPPTQLATISTVSQSELRGPIKDDVVVALSEPQNIAGRAWLICDVGALPMHSEDGKITLFEKVAGGKVEAFPEDTVGVEHVSIPADRDHCYAYWLVYQDSVKEDGLLISFKGVFMDAGNRHGGVVDDALPDFPIPFRIVVLEETFDPIPHDVAQHHHVHHGAQKMTKVVASAPFQVWKHGLPCIQNVVLEKPLTVKKGQFLACANMTGLERRQQQHHGFGGHHDVPDEANNVQVAYVRRHNLPLLGALSGKVLPPPARALNAYPGPQKARATIIWPITEHLVSAKQSSSQQDEIRLQLQFVISHPPALGGNLEVSAVKPAGAALAAHAVRAESTETGNDDDVEGSPTSRKLAKLLQDNIAKSYQDSWWPTVCKIVEDDGSMLVPAPVPTRAQKSLALYRNGSGQTLLHLAVQTNSPKVTALLLSSQVAVDPTVQDVNGRTALHIAARCALTSGPDSDWLSAWHIRTLLKHSDQIKSIKNATGCTAEEEFLAASADSSVNMETRAAFGTVPDLQKVANAAKAAKAEGEAIDAKQAPAGGVASYPAVRSLNTAFTAAADAAVVDSTSADLSRMAREYIAYSREIAAPWPVA